MSRNYCTCVAVSVKVKPVDIVRCVEEVRNDYKADDAGYILQPVSDAHRYEGPNSVVYSIQNIVVPDYFVINHGDISHGIRVLIVRAEWQVAP